MFSIDLLKGQGLPVKTKPLGIAIFVATFAVPALVAILLAGYYVRNQVLISVRMQKIVSFENQTKKLADALKLKESFEKDKTAVNTCMADVGDLLHGHFQWSPVLVTLVENLPDSVVLTNLEIKKTTLRKKPAKGETVKKGDIAIPVRTLKMRVSASPSSNSELEVRSFREKLRASKVLGPKLDDIIIASQGHDTLDGRDVVCFDIDCVFKPGM
jgi:Tfp pilus assembly protein PilN